MCIVKTPKLKPSDTATKPTEPTVIRNPYLDDPAGAKTMRRGRSDLRIDRGTNRNRPVGGIPVLPLQTNPGAIMTGGGGSPNMGSTYTLPGVASSGRIATATNYR